MPEGGEQVGKVPLARPTLHLDLIDAIKHLGRAPDSFEIDLVLGVRKGEVIQVEPPSTPNTAVHERNLVSPTQDLPQAGKAATHPSSFGAPSIRTAAIRIAIVTATGANQEFARFCHLVSLFAPCQI